MSKYKVGDKVNISGKIAGEEYGGYRIETGLCTFWCTDSAIFADQMNAEEAWDIAKKLFADYSNVELDEIFGKGWSYPKLMELTPQEAKAKIEAWEAEKAEKEIKVGDEVMLKSDPGDEYKFFVTNKDGIEISGFSGFNGSVFSCRDIRLYKKTGRHCNIDEFLKQIGG